MKYLFFFCVGVTNDLFSKIQVSSGINDAYASYIHDTICFRKDVGSTFETPPATIFTYSFRLAHIYTWIYLVSGHSATPVTIALPWILLNNKFMSLIRS